MKPTVALRVAVAAGVLFSLQTWQEAGASECAARHTAGRWTAIAYPTMPPAPASVVRDQVPPNPYGKKPVIDPLQPVLAATAAGTLLVSDGYVIQRSVDGGCTWQVVFTLQAAATDSLT